VKARLIIGLSMVAVLVGTAVLFGFAASTSHADPNLANVPPHRHWINGNQVGPDICDNPGNAAIQNAFNEFHNNLHIATASSIGPAAPGLHNGMGGEIRPTPCNVTTAPN
jgi:hypothetical protein